MAAELGTAGDKTVMVTAVVTTTTMRLTTLGGTTMLRDLAQVEETAAIQAVETGAETGETARQMTMSPVLRNNWMKPCGNAGFCAQSEMLLA